MVIRMNLENMIPSGECTKRIGKVTTSDAKYPDLLSVIKFRNVSWKVGKVGIIRTCAICEKRNLAEELLLTMLFSQR